MPGHIECSNCGRTLYGLLSLGPRPIEDDTCPDCGGTEFEILD